MYFYTISKILFCNIILFSLAQASQGQKRYYYNQFVNYNDEYILYSITDSQNIHESKSVNLCAYDLKNKRDLQVNCTMKEGHFFKVRLFSKPTIKFIAAPINYKEDDVRFKGQRPESLYIPVATDKEVFLAEIKKDQDSYLSLELVEKINTHNSTMYSLHSFSTTSMQSVISSSLYPSLKKWTYDNENQISTKRNFVGGVCLGGSADLSYIYVLKDAKERNAIQRYFAREKSDKKYHLYKISEKFDKNDSTKFVQWRAKKLRNETIQLTEPGIFTSALYRKDPASNNIHILEGLFFDGKNLYACFDDTIKIIDGGNSVTDIKQLFCINKSFSKNQRTYTLSFLSGNKLDVFTLTHNITKEGNVNFTLTDHRINNQKIIIGGCLNQDKTGLLILFKNGNDIESRLIEF